MAIEYSRFMDEYVALGRMRPLSDALVSTPTCPLLTVTYGVFFSPYLSLRIIQQLCEDEGHRWPGAATAAMRDRYADDILSGADKLDAARELRNQLICLLQAGGFPMRKWVANVPELLDDLQEEECSTWQEQATDGFVSELGVSWDPSSDHFRLIPPRVQAQDTKRTILATLARLFESCGWLAPTILNAKFLLQDLWRTELDWNEVVPPSMARQWSVFASELQVIHGFAIPRLIGWSPDLDLQLHALSDASHRAMAAVTFSRLTDSKGLVRCHILLAKTKLVPIRTLKPASSPQPLMTIPRLELQAALLAANLL
ncbi:uncharacterized protein LOC106642429 [Copidosoma floridanum]|uniref:uncharacterized protein LOC106642429 n=1 Tax=Copidosoma floridanum TaxID=29053 RepID=UPI0006C974A6|nr:uncharacterized protein LOC106642429 [Copidosoma floridanum]